MTKARTILHIQQRVMVCLQNAYSWKRGREHDLISPPIRAASRLHVVRPRVKTSRSVMRLVTICPEVFLLHGVTG